MPVLIDTLEKLVGALRARGFTAVEGEDFSIGAGLTAAVARAVADLAGELSADRRDARSRPSTAR
jgi:hypothetical protein